VHDQLPCDGAQAGGRQPRLGQGLHDDGSLLYERPEHPRRPAQGFAPRSQRRHQHRADVDRRRQGAVPDDPRDRRNVRRVRAATTKDELNAILRGAATSGDLKDIVGFSEEELVSSDFKRSSFSSIIDSKLNNANGDLVQIAAWYDNEWGYSCRLADVTQMVLSKLPTAV
jgi:hypothetical protein